MRLNNMLSTYNEILEYAKMAEAKTNYEDPRTHSVGAGDYLIILPQEKKYEHIPEVFATLKGVRELGIGNCDVVDLVNCPKAIKGDLKITNLKNLVSLKGIPEKVGGQVYIQDCESLMVLDHLPKTVGGDFCIYYEKGPRFKESDIRKKCNIKGKVLTMTYKQKEAGIKPL